MCIFLCKHKLGFEILTNSNHPHYLTGTWKGWGAVSGNRPCLWKLTRSGSESPMWQAELGTVVLLWIVDNLWNNISLALYPSITFQGLGLRLELHFGQEGTSDGEILQACESHGGPLRTGWMPSWNCPCIYSAAQANGIGFLRLF